MLLGQGIKVDKGLGIVDSYWLPLPAGHFRIRLSSSTPTLCHSDTESVE